MRFLALVLALGVSAPATAGVVSADGRGFEVSNSVDLGVPAAKAYAAFGKIGSWWSDDHSYSGKAANLRLTLAPGGCFCEDLPGGGGVEHLRVVMARPGARIVMTGLLGPVLYEGAGGVMDVKFVAIAAGTRVTMTYRAAGFVKGNGDKLAPLVDKVLAEQMDRFRAFAAK